MSSASGSCRNIPMVSCLVPTFRALISICTAWITASLVDNGAACGAFFLRGYLGIDLSLSVAMAGVLIAGHWRDEHSSPYCSPLSGTRPQKVQYPFLVSALAFTVALVGFQ